MSRGILFASVAGVIGAAIWAAIAYFAQVELGLLAWAIGAGVGFAMLAGAQNEVGLHTGVAALVIALVTIVTGKFLAVEVAISSGFGEVLDEHRALLESSDEFAMTYVADEVVAEYESAGRTLDYPPVINPDAPAGAADYPTDVWAETQTRWDAMSSDEKDQVRKDASDNAKAAMGFLKEMARSEGYKGSFSLFDILWFGLGGFSAFKLGSGITNN